MKSVFRVLDGGDDFWYVSDSADNAKKLHVTTQYESAEIKLDEGDLAEMKVSKVPAHHWITFDGASKPASQWASEKNGFLGTTST